MKLPLIILSSLAPLLLTSCFTGIESTPKITESDVRRENAQTVSKERTFGQTLVPDSLPSWCEGREFKVVDDRIKLLFSSTSDNALPPVGSIIRFHEAVPVLSMTGDSVTVMKFLSGGQAADTLEYKIDTGIDELKSRATVTLPFVIDMEFVGKVNGMLRGKVLYLLTPNRYTLDGTRMQGRKFIPVTVTEVVAGNTDFPLRVLFTEDSAADTCAMLMSAGAGKLSSRNFDSLFSLTDPRQRYPLITDENWEAITRGKVRIDMTRDECRLSVGTPSEVIRGHNYSSAYERWIYTNGALLEFEDGLLKRYRL